MANPSVTTELTAINSLTHPLISKRIADNITGRIPYLYLMNKVGNKEHENGGLDYRLPVFKETVAATAYTGAAVFTPVETSLVSTAIYQRKQITIDVLLTGTKLLQNSGDDPTAVINYIASQIEIAEENMKNTMAGRTIGLFSNLGEADVGITGLQNFLTPNTATGTCGGFDRATYTFWRQQSDSVATGFNTDGLHSMRLLQLACVRGDEVPSIIIMTRAGYANLDRALTGTLNYNNPSPKTQFGDIGFEHINFKGSIVIFDDGVPDNQAYFLNLKYFKLLVHQKRDMVIRDFIAPSNQDVIVGRMFWAGNQVCNNLARQGILQGLIETWA